ncbi:MAG TPA: hypothetical protein VHE35_21230 [Kofleriaceae bacterium]|nr:hypothetical protein [Kofleriaceae bacterium]
MSRTSSALLASIVLGVGGVAAGACGDPGSPDCSVKITDTSIDGNTMTANGTFITAQPLLVLMMGATRMVIPGDDDGDGHATFDLTGLPPGSWDYSFDASCYDENDSPHVTAPTGFFTRS